MMSDSKKDKRSYKSRIYYQMAKHYEAVFARFFRDRVRSAIRSLEIEPGATVLELGVGTGLSLMAYPEHAEVTGIDLSPEMLRQAQEKVDRHGWDHIQLQQMDAQALELGDAQFDYVVAFHVVSVVPDHKKMVDEMVRVAKREATVLIINHFRSERWWLAAPIDLLDPVTRHLGWRTTLRLSDILDQQPLQVEARYKTSPRSLFTIVEAKKKIAEPSRTCSMEMVR